MGMRLNMRGVIIWRRLAAVLLLLGSTGLCSNIQAATEIGAIPGSFAVSPTGAATYTIPINVPPGVGGLTPHLSLVYDSQLGNGLAGYGWMLSGLSVITVCNKTWAQDGINQSVNFTGTYPDPNDKCLDGQKLFITSNGTYRKELDDFSQITAYTSGGAGPTPTVGPQYFTVQTSDGLTYEYGKTADSEIVATGSGVPSGVTMVRAWALDQIFDKYGNSISFTYQQDTTNGDFWPTQITYTNHGSIAGSHTIVFHYTSLAGISTGLVWTSYLGGALISQTQRLNEIDVDYNGSPTFTYSLAYGNTLIDGKGNTGTERSRLTSMTECASSTCYPATTINWQDGTSGWSGANSTGVTGLTSTEAKNIQLIDVNGDGRADLVYPGSSDWMIAFANGSGFDAAFDTGVPVGNYADALPMDIDGSGRTGLLEPNSSNNWQILVPMPDGSSPGGYTFQAITLYDHATNAPIPATGAGGNATVADINGDGLDDVLFSDGTNLNWLENVGGGNAGYDIAGSATLSQGAFSSSGNDVIHRDNSFAGGAPDFDGSGRGGFMTYTQVSSGPGCTPDYCPPNPPPPTPKWSISQGGGYWNISPTWLGTITGDPGNLVIPMFVDFNGDGLTDLLYANTATNVWRVFNSTGASLVEVSTGGIGWDPNVMLDSLGVDYSGNGREDVLLEMTNSSGTCTDLGIVGFAGGVFHGDQSIGMSGEGPCASGYTSGSFRAADITGNGLQDLVWVANGTVYYALHNGVHPDLVTSLSNGFSQTYANIVYAPLSNGAPYTPGNATIPTKSFSAEGGTATVPEGRNYTGPIYVVSSYTANDGVGGTVSHSFSYSGALIDTLGRGFLGFAATTATDSRAVGGSAVNTLTASNHDQWFPETGDPTSVTVSVNGNTQSNVSTTWAPLATIGGAQYVYASSSTTSRNELGTSSPYMSVTASYPNPPTLNSSGVLTQQVIQQTTSPATVTSTTTTTYQVDTGNWCLNLPASVTVENVGNNTNNEVNGSDMTRTVTYTPDTQHCRITGKSVSVTDSSTTQTLSTTDSYDPSYGTLIEQDVNASGGTCGTQGTCYTKYSYDPTNTFVVQVTNALGEISKATWDPSLGVELSATDPNSVATSFSYDSFGLKKLETLGDGTSVQWNYCLPANGCSVPSGSAYSVTATHYSTNSTAGKTATTVYDSFGRPLLQSIYVVGGALSNVATAYDALGHVISVSTPYQGSPGTYTYTVYDLFNRASAVYTPAGQHSGCSASYGGETACETSYGYAGLTTSVTDPKNNTTSKTVDALGEVTQMTDAAGGIIYYSYDSFGDLTQTKDPAGSVTSMNYDTLGRKLQMTDPDMGTWNYGYDPRGLVTSQTDPKGKQITMNYDALGRLTSRTEPLASGSSGTDTWTYDGPSGVPTAPDIGKLVEVQGADGYVKQYQYDSTGRPLEQDAAIAGTIYSTNTAYDTFGRVASITYPATPVPDADDPPVAVAGPNQAGVVGQTITLNGSGSYDPDHGPQPLTYKWVQTGGPAGTSADGVTTANASFSTATAGTYDFTLTVGDGVLTDSANTSVAVAPTQVTGLSSSTVAPATGDFTLSWSPDEGAQNYNIEQSTNGGSYSLLTGSWSGTSAALTGYSNGSYNFAVQGCGNSVCGAFSSPYTVTVLRLPSQPATPTVSPTTSTNGNFTVYWSQPAGTITYYELYTSFNGGAYSAGTNVGNVLSHALNESVNGTYDIEVAACNSGGCGSPSNPVAETVSLPVPAAPTLSANPTSIYLDNSSTLSWTRPGGVSTSYFMVNGTNVGNVTSYTVSPVRTTSYDVRGCNNAGCGAWSNSVTVTVTIGGCKTCAPQTAPSSTTTSAPSASSGSSSAAAESLFDTSVAAISSADEINMSAVQLIAGAKADNLQVHAPRRIELSDLRHAALRVEAQRLAEQKPIARPALQPLYAAEVETARGNLLSMQQAVANGAVNSYQLAAHAEKTTGTSRFTVDYNYDTHGNLVEVVDDADQNLIYWQATAGNVFGQVTADILGNGVIDTYGFDPNTGEELQAQSGVGNSIAVQKMSYQWDGDGNLTQRQDQNAGLTETFQYGSLNRLTQAQVSGAANSTQQFYYDAVGDLTSRTGVGTYNYTDASHPQQISSITAPNGSVRNFSYDPDGNITNDGIHINTWDALNRLTEVQDFSAGAAVQFAYTPSGARYQEMTTVGAATTTLIEVNALFEVQYSSATGHTNYRASIVGGTGIVAIRTVRDDGVLTTRYVTSNHLGGVSVITDEVGTVDERMSYGAFGERRDPTNWQPYSSAPDLTDITDKGYTGQQQLDAVGLVHMNGRVYDPQIGRFLSADPTVPDPLDSQSFARYAYVENNPLSAIDPSGFQEVPESEIEGWYHDANTGRNFCMGPNCPALVPSTNIPSQNLGIQPLSLISPSTTPVPPAPSAPPPPPSQPQQQQQQQQQKPCDCTSLITDPNNLNSPFNSWQFYDGYQIGNCGTACGDGFVTGIPDWSSIGGSGKFPVRGPVEIPGPNGHYIGSPVAGPSRAPGSVGVPWANPTGGQIRPCGAWGCGYFGAPRDNGTRRHLGTDYLATPGQNVFAVMSGTVTKIGYPYPDDLSFRDIHISNGGYLVNEMYVNPAQGIKIGVSVNAGDVIGTAQDLDTRYPGIPDHVHVGIWLNGNPVNPATLIPLPPILPPPNQ